MNTKGNLLSIIIAIILAIVAIIMICIGIKTCAERSDISDEESAPPTAATTETESSIEATEEPISEQTEVTETETTSPPLTLASMYDKYDLEADAIMLAKLVYAEAGVVKSSTERACVIWTVLNRVDKYGTSVETEVTKPHQFAWHEDSPVYGDMLDLAYDVLARWYLSKETGELCGRVLSGNYYYFYGDGRHNHFFADWNECKARVNEWDYSLPSPYEN